MPNSPGFDPSILRHCESLGAADEAVLYSVHKKTKNPQNPPFIYAVLYTICPSPTPSPVTIGQEKEKWHCGENQKKESDVDVGIKYLNLKELGGRGGGVWWWGDSLPQRKKEKLKLRESSELVQHFVYRRCTYRWDVANSSINGMVWLCCSAVGRGGGGYLLPSPFMNTSSHCMC